MFCVYYTIYVFKKSSINNITAYYGTRAEFKKLFSQRQWIMPEKSEKSNPLTPII